MKTVAVALIQCLQIVKEWPFHKFLFFFKLIQCSVIFGGRYMCICQTCVFFKFVQFCKAFHGIYTMYMYVLVKLQTRVQYHRLMVCVLTHHNIVYLCFVPKDISCTMLSSWEKNKRKKKRLFPKEKGPTLEYGCGRNFQSKLFLRWKQYSP